MVVQVPPTPPERPEPGWDCWAPERPPVSEDTGCGTNTAFLHGACCENSSCGKGQVLGLRLLYQQDPSTLGGMPQSRRECSKRAQEPQAEKVVF